MGAFNKQLSDSGHALARDAAIHSFARSLVFRRLPRPVNEIPI